MTTRPDKVLRVHFTGEVGIDSGAMAKEILARPIADILCFPLAVLWIQPTMYRRDISSLVEKLLL